MTHTALGQFGPPLLFILIGVLWSAQRRDDANPDDRVWMAGLMIGALVITTFVWSPYTRIPGTVLFVAVVCTLLYAIGLRHMSLHGYCQSARQAPILRHST